MFGTRSTPLLHRVCALIVILVFASSAFGQDDTDPNSPTPALFAIVSPAESLSSRSPRRFTGKAVSTGFVPGQEAILYVSNLDLMKGEGANAFRVYVEDGKGRHYRFPVRAIRPVKGSDGVYALTVQLRDASGFWEQPGINGDLIFRLSWRGLTSNRLKLNGGSVAAAEKVSTNSSGSDGPVSEYGDYRWSGDRIRFLEQAAFGPTVALDQRIRRIGIRTWLAEQFDAPYPSTPYPDISLRSTNAEDPTLGCGMFLPNTTPEYRLCIRDHYSQYPLQNWFYKEAFYGEPQLRHRVAWALSQLWVVSGLDTQQASWMIAYHKVLANNAFGNYRTLMKEMTLNPAMGNYLDMVRSTRNNPNENYPREILQLFSVGLFMLNPDGTLQLDNAGDPIPTYDQSTVNNFTKVFTGWTFCNTTCPSSQPGIVNYKDPMILNQNNHDITAKTLLSYPNAVNTSIPSGLNGGVELDMALDNIFNHPNVGPFVSKYLIQQLVTSDPSPAYVERVAAVFNNNGFGVRGDLKAVIRTILLDPEARGDVKTDPNFGKLREPVQLMTNVMRHFGVRSADGSTQSDGVVNGLANALGQNTFNSPTVFNYYPPDYVVPGTSLPGPEYALMTTGFAVARANFANTMVYSRVNISLPNTPLGTSLDLSELQAIAAADPTCSQLMDILNQRMMHNAMPPEMRSTILTAVTSIASTNPLARAQQAVYLIATSSQYQVQR